MAPGYTAGPAVRDQRNQRECIFPFPKSRVIPLGVGYVWVYKGVSKVDRTKILRYFSSQTRLRNGTSNRIPTRDTKMERVEKEGMIFFFIPRGSYDKFFIIKKVNS